MITTKDIQLTATLHVEFPAEWVEDAANPMSVRDVEYEVERIVATAISQYRNVRLEAICVEASDVTLKEETESESHYEALERVHGPSYAVEVKAYDQLSPDEQRAIDEQITRENLAARKAAETINTGDKLLAFLRSEYAAGRSYSFTELQYELGHSKNVERTLWLNATLWRLSDTGEISEPIGKIIPTGVLRQ